MFGGLAKKLIAHVRTLWGKICHILDDKENDSRKTDR